MPNALYNQAAAALQDPRINAFLDAVVRTGEGTAGPAGYQTIFGGHRFTDMSHHPNQKFCHYLASTGRTHCSEAAGAFQFMFPTWSMVRTALDLPDFDVYSQRLGAADLLRRRGSLAALQANDIVTAIVRARNEWTSLPGASQASGSRTMASAVAQYNNALGNQVIAEPPAPIGWTPAPLPAAAPSADPWSNWNGIATDPQFQIVIAAGVLLLLFLSRGD